MDEQAWQQKSAEILTDIKEWRRAHPTATFVEMENEVHKPTNCATICNL